MIKSLVPRMDKMIQHHRPIRIKYKKWSRIPAIFFSFVVNKCNWTNDTGCNRELFKSILDFQFEQQNDKKFYDFSKKKTQPEKRESVDTGFFIVR